MTIKTDIVNKTKQSFELKEGNAGAYRFLKQLDAGDKVSIKVDPNATYREYMVATGRKGETIILTSDDFSEYKVIDIEEVPGQVPGAVIYKSVPRNPRKPGSSKDPEPSIVGGAGVGSDLPASSAAAAGSVPPASSTAATGSVPPASSATGAGSDPPASSTAAAGSVPPASSASGAGSAPAFSSAPGAGSNPRASSVASSKPPIGNTNQNERVPWYKKLKSRFKLT